MAGDLIVCWHRHPQKELGAETEETVGSDWDCSLRRGNGSNQENIVRSPTGSGTYPRSTVDDCWKAVSPPARYCMPPVR